MRQLFQDQRERMRTNADRLIAAATAFRDPDEAGRMLDQAIALMTRERVLGRMTR